jgi:hypothetical protein
MNKRKTTKGQTMICKILHRKFNVYIYRENKYCKCCFLFQKLVAMDTLEMTVTKDVCVTMAIVIT